MELCNRSLEDQAYIDTILCPIHQIPIYFIDVQARTSQGQRTFSWLCKLDQSISLEDFRVKWDEYRKPLSNFKNSQTLNSFQKQRQLEKMKTQQDSVIEQTQFINLMRKKIGKLNQFKSRSDYEEIQSKKYFLNVGKKQSSTKVIFEAKDIEKKISKITNSITELHNNQSKLLDQIMKEFSSQWNMKKLETAEKILIEHFAEKSNEDKLSKINLSIKLYPPKPQVSLLKPNLIEGNALETYHLLNNNISPTLQKLNC